MKPLTRTAISAAPRALGWIRTTRSARPLHIFDQAINLVNQDDQVLSLVTPIIGNGPFSLVVAGGGFQGVASSQSSISVGQETLTVGSLSIDCRQVKHWNPRPNWKPLTRSQLHILTQSLHAELSATVLDSNFPAVLASAGSVVQVGTPFAAAASRAVGQIKSGLQHDEQKLIFQGAAALAGLGIGLTPAGDDFLVGLIYGLWARAAEKAKTLCRAIAQTAGPLTSTLSAAWLEVASQGEAAQDWHELILAIQAGNTASIGPALQHILHTGETSGADALTGYFFALNQEKSI